MVRLTPIKGNLLTLLPSGVSDRQGLFGGAVRGPEVPSISAAFVGEERGEDGGTRQYSPYRNHRALLLCGEFVGGLRRGHLK